MTSSQSGKIAGDAPAASGEKSGENKAGRLALWIILTPILATLIWGAGTWLTRPPVVEEILPPFGVGLPAPGFTFPSLGGGPIALEDMRGKTVLINIWATWCPPCIKEMPSIQNLYETMKKNGIPFEVLAVSIDALGGDAVQKWVDRFGLTFPILLDPRGRIKKIYRTTGVPESFIVGPDGRLARRIIGALEWDTPGVISYMTQVGRTSISKKPTASKP